MTIYPSDVGCRRVLRAGCALIALGMPLHALADAHGLRLPSGQSVETLEFILEPQADGEIWARARFLAPGLETGLAHDAVESDFPWLCENWVLQALSDQGLHADQAIVSLSSRRIEFGDSDPDTIQFFEVFSLKDNACIWEMF